MSAIRKRKSGLWQFDGYVLDGSGRSKRIRVSLKTRDKREAMKAARKLQQDISANGLEPVADLHIEGAGMTFDEWAETWFEDYVSMKKYSTGVSYESLYRVHIHPMFGESKLADIKPQDVMKFIRTMKAKKKSDKTVNNALAVLKSMFRDAHANDHVEMNIMTKVKALKVPAPAFRYYTERQSDAFLVTCRKMEPDFYPLALAFFSTGMRFGEIGALTWDQLDFVRDVIVVDRAVYLGKVGTPKGGESREVPMHPELKKVLWSYRQLRHLKTDLVFPGRLKTHIQDHEYLGALHRARRHVGLPRITFHGMRHSYASQLVIRGVSLYIVQKLLGHKHIETTMRYAHLSPEAKDEAVQMLYSDLGLVEENDESKDGKAD